MAAQKQGRVNFEWALFQGNSSSSLLNMNALIPLTLVLRSTEARVFAQEKGKEKLNHLFMVDLNLYNNSDDTGNLVRSVSGNIGMKFGVQMYLAWHIKAFMPKSSLFF